MSLGLFLTALLDEEAEEVGMNEVGFIAFHTPTRCIGTRNLNSCTGVIIASQHAAILAHIAPLPPYAAENDFHAGDRHTSLMMEDLADLYRRHENYFLTEKPSWVVSALWNEEIALPSQKAIVEESLRQINLTPATVNYQVITRQTPRGPGKGTIFIDGRGGSFPAIYVEDQLIAGPPPTP